MSKIKLKIILIGDSSVGKTSLLYQYIDNKFDNSYIATIGVEYKEKYIKFRNNKVLLEIWDTSGQEKFHSMTRSYFRNTSGALYVYDITEKKSFDNIKKWVNDSEKLDINCKKILVGNKCDLDDKRVISKEELNDFIEEKKIQGFEISAKNGKNVQEAFHNLVAVILGNKTDEEIKEKYGDKDLSFSLSSLKFHKKKKKKGNCCG